MPPCAWRNSVSGIRSDRVRAVAHTYCTARTDTAPPEPGVRDKLGGSSAAEVRRRRPARPTVSGGGNGIRVAQRAIESFSMVTARCRATAPTGPWPNAGRHPRTGQTSRRQGVEQREGWPCRMLGMANPAGSMA